ncbi:MAG: 4Fe-4S binding protein [Candidatus Latescibacterota bacterium]
MTWALGAAAVVVAALTEAALRRLARSIRLHDQEAGRREAAIAASLGQGWRAIQQARVELGSRRGQLAARGGLSPYEITDACISCGNCRPECAPGVIEEGYPFRIRSEECTGCDRCRRACPVDACRPLAGRLPVGPTLPGQARPLQPRERPSAVALQTAHTPGVSTP